MERKDVNTLYSNIFEQLGGSKSSSSKNNKKNDFYIPSDLSLKSQGDMSKLFRANRILQKELNETKLELEKTKKELEKTKIQLEKAKKR